MIALDQGGAALESARSVVPHRRVRGWASALWSDTSSGAAWRIVADDAPHLIYSETDSPTGLRTRLTLVGARATFLDIDRAPRRRTIALRLKPGALRGLFGVRGCDLTDRGVGLAHIVGDSLAAEWLEQMAQADDGMKTLNRLLAEWITGVSWPRHGPTGEAPDWRVRAALRLDADREAGGSLSSLADAAGLSTRTLRRVFAEHVGLSPIHTLRIRRLHRALLSRMAEQGTPLTWAAVAMRAGYSDQAHLIRDCRALLGETPRQFMGRRSRVRFVQS